MYIILKKLILFFKPFDPKKSRAGRRISTFPVEKKIFYSLDFPALTTVPGLTKFSAFYPGKSIRCFHYTSNNKGWQHSVTYD
jgi:hypothetical protein